MARCLAVPMSQAPGLSGIPESGHCSSAATSASCARSSATPMSPTMRANPAMSLADSIRQTASMVSATLGGVIHHRPELDFDLVRPEPDVRLEKAPRPFERLLLGRHVADRVAADHLLPFAERSVLHGDLPVGEPQPRAGRRGPKATRADPDPLVHHLGRELVDLLEARRRPCP